MLHGAASGLVLCEMMFEKDFESRTGALASLPNAPDQMSDETG
jgi:hypothetical protein